MNKLLQRQINEHIPNRSSLTPEIEQLLKAISETYEQRETVENWQPNAKTQANPEDLTVINNRLLAKARELRKKEIHLNISQHMALVGSWELDEQSQELFWSDETYSIFGVKKGSVPLTLDFFYSQVHPEDFEKIKLAFETAISTQTPYNVKHRLLNGKIVQEKAEIIYGDDGKPLKMIGIVQDVTEREQAEQALRDSEHKFQSLIQNSADVITVLGRDANVLFVSDSVQRITGFTPEEIVTRNTLDFIHPDDVPLLKQVHAQVLENTKNVVTAEYRRLRKDGSYMWCEGSATNLLHDKAIGGIVINFRDITQRKSYETALKNSEHKLRALLENSSEAIILVDDRLVITFASDSLKRVAGYAPEDMIGLPILSLAHPDEKDMIIAFMQDVINSPGQPRKLIYKTRKKDGSYIWCERITINLLEDPAINGIVSNFRDITERIEREEDMSRYNEDMRKKNEELDKFVYSVSHDLRAPLTSVMGLIQVARLNDDREEMMATLDMISMSINRLDGFICDVLNYSRNERLELKQEKIDFDSLLNEVTENLKFINASSTDIRITRDINGEADFYADRQRIAIVLNNLVSNAIKYHDPEAKDPYIHISVKKYPQYAEISIADNGVGIDKEYHEKIFQMFFRASAATLGSGLGLYIVGETLKKLNGEIKLDSVPGEGSTFTVTIPNNNS